MMNHHRYRITKKAAIALVGFILAFAGSVESLAPSCHGVSRHANSGPVVIGSPTNTKISVSRRNWLNRLIGSGFAGIGIVAADAKSSAASAAAATAATAADPRRTVILHLESPQVKAGLELADVMIGSPPRIVPAIRRVLPQATRLNSAIQPGLVLREYASSAEVVERLSNGPYPIDLIFENLAAGGDAFGDLEKPLVTAQDALELSRTTAATPSPVAPKTSSGRQDYAVRNLKTTAATAASPDNNCRMKSRRGDVLEIRYEARLRGPDGPVYDASEQRGTGLPYQMVLGSGDMLPGVDLGLYDMCPGDVRGLEIPPPLAYGDKGNRLWDIPPNTRLYWSVELVSVNSVREGDERSRDEMEARQL